jgi:hypothetical protein
MAHTGHPAPFRLGAPAYLAALCGWVAAAVLLVAAAPDLARTAVSGTYAVGVVFFPFAWRRRSGSCFRSCSGTEGLALGVAREASALARTGATFLVAAALVALAAGVETTRRARTRT